jgi:L-threonylcarbamoyladenylate synthase
VHRGANPSIKPLLPSQSRLDTEVKLQPRLDQTGRLISVIFMLARRIQQSIPYFENSSRQVIVTMASTTTPPEVFETRVLDVRSEDWGRFAKTEGTLSVESWQLPTVTSPEYQVVERTAVHMQTSNVPVAFPTETVYGLGADATRSEAVKGIYKAKGRPSDNPLIVHICDLEMLRGLLVPARVNGDVTHSDPIPSIYKPLIERFWPGPLTILLPNPANTRLAPEVTAGLKTFGVRMPSLPLALSLIKLAGVPLAAPSANASTRPSPTTAQHVLHDLNGRIEMVLDGGACDVGVESTVVDGLCDPPVVLRPGGLSIESIRECKGWEQTVKAYKDESELGSHAPRAPGMKYKHYSPKAKVVLCEDGSGITLDDLTAVATMQSPRIGIVRTKRWAKWAGFGSDGQSRISPPRVEPKTVPVQNGTPNVVSSLTVHEAEMFSLTDSSVLANLVEVELGTDTRSIAHGLFSALRELDGRNADLIFVEGIEDEGDIAAAVMNRLRKAATDIRR